MRHSIGIALLGIVTALGASHGALADGWRYYAGDAGGTRYSSLTQVNRGNVGGLKVAWIYRGQDVSTGEHVAHKTGFEATPIVLGGTMYLCSGYDRVIALDPVTGREKCNYAPHIHHDWNYGDGFICRGVTGWPAGSSHPQRIFVATEDARLVALDAGTGKPAAGFGRNGEVDLGDGVANYLPGAYHMTSAPTVAGNAVIVGSAINDSERAVMPSGVVRAYDVGSGALLWKFDPVPQGPGIHSGAANARAPMSVDAKRGLVFVPTGSASPDYYDVLYLDVQLGTRSQLAPDEFLRVHRSHVVRIGFIAEMRPMFHGDYELILRDGAHVSLSRRYKRLLPATIRARL